MRKFEEVLDVSDYSIKTPDGFKPINKVMKTIPYQVWLLTLEDDYYLECADDHIVMFHGKEVFVKDLKVGDLVETEEGDKKVLSVVETERIENMYDFEIDSEDHTFYSNGILSHNTTSIMVYLAWYTIFHENKTVAIVADGERNAKKILRSIRDVFEYLPEWVVPEITEDNAKSIRLANGTHIFCAATSPNCLAGESISILYMDELALVQRSIQEDFWRANNPTVEHGEKIIVSSTPRGVGDIFHTIWKGALAGDTEFKAIRVDYWEVDDYSSEKWKKAKIKEIGLVAFNSEYGNQFVGSTTTIISSEILQKLHAVEPLEVNEIHGGEERYYEEYDSNFQYIASCDVGMGCGSDYSTLTMWKIYWHYFNEDDLPDWKLIHKDDDEEPPEILIDKIRLTYVFKSNLISITNLTRFVFEKLPEYGQPFFIFENNGCGVSVVENMKEDYYYENAYVGDKGMYGVNANASTKTKMIARFKYFLETERCEFADDDLINEILTFVEKKSTAGNNKYQAEEGSHDDLVMPTGWACWLSSSIWLQDMLTFS